MAIYPYLLDILKYTVSGLGVVWIAFYLIKPYLDKSERIQLLEFKKSIANQTLPLRLQAYERIILFMERINPENMIVRLNGPGYSAADLHSIIITEIRNEYQHNITQQIYVSSRAWGVAKHVKDDTLNIVTSAFKSLPETATGLELGKLILGQLSQFENNPYEIGVEGGGCSGMSYVLGFDQKKDGDQEFLIDGLRVFMHKAHGLYLAGMQINYQDGLNARGFTFNNPNAASTCGCGTSFSV